MMRKKVALYVGRFGLILGGAYIALGAQMRGLIDWSNDWEFWLLPIVMLCMFVGKHYADRPNGTDGATRDPFDPDTFYSSGR
jgi:hypothetical protein